MRGYLLDTNVLSSWLMSTRPQHQTVCSKMESLPPGTPLMTSIVVIGEMEYGLQAVDQSMRASLGKVLDEARGQLPRALPIDESTAAVYGSIRARLFDKYGPKYARRKVKRPEQLVDPATSKTLGIHENDLWIAAQAVARNLVLASCDAHMSRIGCIAPELTVEDWGKPSA